MSLAMQEMRLEVEEIACKTCARKVCDALRAVEGVVAVHVQDSSERLDGPADRTLKSCVFVKFVPAYVSAEQLAAAIRAAGYRVAAPA